MPVKIPMMMAVLCRPMNTITALALTPLRASMYTVRSYRNEYSLFFFLFLSSNTSALAFRWTPWGIEWEVNGQIVHKVDNIGGKTPIVTANTVQKVMLNAWIVNESAEPFFGGAFDEASFTSANAEYRWIRYEKLDENGCCAISPSCT